MRREGADSSFRRQRTFWRGRKWMVLIVRRNFRRPPSFRQTIRGSRRERGRNPSAPAECRREEERRKKNNPCRDGDYLSITCQKRCYVKDQVIEKINKGVFQDVRRAWLCFKIGRTRLCVNPRPAGVWIVTRPAGGGGPKAPPPRSPKLLDRFHNFKRHSIALYVNYPHKVKS